MNLHMQRLFDSLKDAVLIVSSAGQVLYANPLARTIFPTPLGQPLTVEWLHSQIRSIECGYLRPPLTFEIDLPGLAGQTRQFQVALLSSPVAANFFIVLQEVTAERLYDTVINNLAEMLDSEFREPMEQFLGATAETLAQCESLAVANFDLRNSVAKMSEKGNALTGLLNKIGLLASTFKASSIRGDERILLPAMVAEVVLATKALLDEKRISVSYCGIDDSLPVIYGSRYFLVQALAGYVCYLVERIGREVNILISAKLKGNFILLSIANCEGINPVGSKQDILPLLGRQVANTVDPLGLSLPICKRVIELCGGSLSFEEAEGEIRGLVFELPVGSPSVDLRDLGLLQAQRYAEDYHTVLQRLANAKQA